MHIMPDGKKFPWGRIVKTYEIGAFLIVEYIDKADTAFHVYVGVEDTHEGSRTLDGALLIALAHKHCGKHSGASHWMARLLGLHGDEL